VSSQNAEQGRASKGPEARGPEDVLRRLIDLLAAERSALVRLDREAIEAFAVSKLTLDQELRAWPEAAFEETALPLLRTVRERAFENQLLLVNARACVKGVLNLISPETAPAYRPGASISKPPALALNVKG
jgi:hypothetical protein